MQNIKVIIIGAGISGISAASKLLENGFSNLTILEAEKRIGGRVNTVPFAANCIDLGAQWCHGEKNNVVHELVKDHNVLDESVISYPNVNFVSSTGRQLDDSKCFRLVTLCQDILNDCEEDLKSYKGSLGSYVVKKYEEALQQPDFADIDAELSYQVLDYFHKFENSIEASDSWFDTSGNGYLSYWECEGHPLLNWKDKGYSSVIDFITKKMPDPAQSLDVESKVLLNKEVCAIDWLNPSRSHLVVRCSDGTSYDANHVIVTVSLGVLKENYKTLFHPQLPAMKINAIEGLSIGVVNKIFLEFKQPFWDDDFAGFSLLWTHNDSTAIRATPNAWLEDIFGFYRVDYQPNILCGWIGGPSARAMEQLDDATVLKGCQFLFEKFLGNRMPWTMPVKLIRSSWYSNKHFRGSYSFRSITTDLLRTSAQELAHPLYDSLGKPSVLFAGEATSDHYYSTVHGAVGAGWREASRLTEFYKGQHVKEDGTQKISNVANEIEYFDSIILGAGVAGLGAGEVLQKANLKFTILEGQDRVGGRINTIPMKNLKISEKTVHVDAGGQWLHGKSNELYDFAKKFDLIHPQLSEEAGGDYIREDGEIFDDFFVKKVDFVFGQILEECENLVEHKNQKNFEFPKSIEDIVEERFKKFTDELQSDDEKRKALQLLDWHRKFQVIDNSCLRFGDISAKNWGNYSFNGESCQTHINVKNGMGAVTDKLHKLLKDHIKLNQVVELIYWKDEEYIKKSNVIKVLCNDGSVYATNNLICTFSLGVLKKHHLDLFSPPLPKAYREVIECVGYGTINKIFLYFDEQWWDDKWKGLQLIWNEENDNNSHWSKFISGFDVVFPEPKNTLLGWIGGRGAIEMEKLSDEEIADECVKMIRKFLQNSTIPDPSKFYCSRWNSNDFIQGAYSFTSRTSDHIQDWESILSRPITYQANKQNRINTLLLAGEACHGKYFSTVHGGFLSGVEQAQKIVNSYCENSNKFSDVSCLSKL